MAEAEAEAVQSLEELTANLGEYRAQHGQARTAPLSPEAPDVPNRLGGV